MAESISAQIGAQWETAFGLTLNVYSEQKCLHMQAGFSRCTILGIYSTHSVQNRREGGYKIHKCKRVAQQENYRIVGCEEVTPIWGYNNLKVVPLYWLKEAISGRY